MRLPAGQSPGLRHRRTPGHASSHGEEPDDGSYRSSGQVLITRAAAAAARRRDPTNPAPAQPPGAGGAGAGGAPQDWGRGARSRDTVRLRAPWPPPGKRSLIERSASPYPRELSLDPPKRLSAPAALAGRKPLAVAGRRIQKVHDLGSRKWPSHEGLCWSVRTLAPEARPATASWSAVAACASGRVAATWSESRPCASVSTSAASRAPSART